MDGYVLMDYFLRFPIEFFIYSLWQAYNIIMTSELNQA